MLYQEKGEDRQEFNNTLLRWFIIIIIIIIIILLVDCSRRGMFSGVGVLVKRGRFSASFFSS